MENNSKIVSAGLVGLLHEMNNPLTSIKLCLELMQTANDDTREEYYKIIKKSTEQLQLAVHQISDCFLTEGFVVNFEGIEPISVKSSSTVINR